MTPGLAGFIASGHDEQAWEQSVAGVLTALAAEFEVVPERGGEPARRPADVARHLRLAAAQGRADP